MRGSSGKPGMDDANHREYQGGAIGGQRIVKAWVPRKLVRRGGVFKQQLSRIRLRHAQAKDTNILAANVAGHSHHVAFISGNDRQLIFLEESGQCRPGLIARSADLDRKCHPGAIVEPETDDGVGNPFVAPLGHDEIDIGHLGQVESPPLPTGIEVGVAAPCKVSHVIENEPISIDRRGNAASDIGCPVPVIRRRNRRPPDEEDGHQPAINGEYASPPGRKQGCHGGQNQGERRRGNEIAGDLTGGKSEPKDERTPGPDEQNNEGEKAEPDPAGELSDDAPHCAGSATLSDKAALMRSRTVLLPAAGCSVMLPGEQPCGQVRARCSSRIRRTSATVCGFD